MSEIEQSTSETSEQAVNPVEALRNEFQEQFTTMQSSFEATIAELKASNEALTKHNQELERALVRSATSPPEAPKPQPKSEEEIYKDKIQALAQKTLQYEKLRL